MARITTVHKAKGKQSKVVIVLYAQDFDVVRTDRWDATPPERLQLQAKSMENVASSRTELVHLSLFVGRWSEYHAEAVPGWLHLDMRAAPEGAGPEVTWRTTGHEGRVIDIPEPAHRAAG